MFDWQAVVADLELLNQSVSVLEGKLDEQIEEYISVGEYALALDDIASVYLTRNVAMPPDLFEIFEKLAVEMDMESDPEYDAVARLRAATKARQKT